MRFLWIVATLPLLAAGCANPRLLSVSRIEIPAVPDDLRSCRNAPALPIGANTQRDAARLIVLLHERGEDCAAKLKALVDITDAAQQRVNAFNQQNTQLP